MSELKLSASRIDLYNQCSWLYYLRYIRKVPNASNFGSMRGSICHTVFETLLNSRHRKVYDEIISRGDIFFPVMERWIRRLAKKEGLKSKFDNNGEDNWKMISDMIYTGLSIDFFCEGRILHPPEMKFSLESESPRYKLAGIIDKLAENPDFMEIKDYKSSKDTFEGAKLEENIQALIYILYISKTFKKPAVVDFIFLRFPDNPLRHVEFPLDVLEGFEFYLENIYDKLEGFSYDVAQDNMAADLGWPPKEKEGFIGMRACGLAKFPGEMNAAHKQGKPGGKKLWHCSQKFPYKYWVMIENGNIINSERKLADLPIPQDGQSIEARTYEGCPSFKHLW